MLIALEEEAAIEQETLQKGRDETTWLKVLSNETQQQSVDEPEPDVELQIINRFVYCHPAHLLRHASLHVAELILPCCMPDASFDVACKQAVAMSIS